MYNKTFTLYQIKVDNLALKLGDGSELLFPSALSNGRVNYVLFEELVRHYAGLTKVTKSDHKDAAGKKYEQKSYKDAAAYPNSADLFQCAASNTFGANNNGPKIKKLLASGNYDSALEICKQTGYDHNDYYIFTNSGGFKPGMTFEYFIVPTETLLKHLDSEDPRVVSRSTMLGLIKSKVKIV